MHQVTLITNVELVINCNLFYFINNCLMDSHYSFRYAMQQGCCFFFFFKTFSSQILLNPTRLYTRNMQEPMVYIWQFQLYFAYKYGNFGSFFSKENPLLRGFDIYFWIFLFSPCS
jgi:hypothetical protein